MPVGQVRWDTTDGQLVQCNPGQPADFLSIDLGSSGYESRFVARQCTRVVLVLPIPGSVVSAHPVVDVELQNLRAKASSERQRVYQRTNHAEIGRIAIEQRLQL